MGLDSISFLNFDEKWEKTVETLKTLLNSRYGLI